MKLQAGDGRCRWSRRKGLAARRILVVDDRAERAAELAAVLTAAHLRVAGLGSAALRRAAIETEPLRSRLTQVLSPFGLTARAESWLDWTLDAAAA